MHSNQADNLFVQHMIGDTLDYSAATTTQFNRCKYTEWHKMYLVRLTISRIQEMTVLVCWKDYRQIKWILRYFHQVGRLQSSRGRDFLTFSHASKTLDPTLPKMQLKSIFWRLGKCPLLSNFTPPIYDTLHMCRQSQSWDNPDIVVRLNRKSSSRATEDSTAY